MIRSKEFNLRGFTLIEVLIALAVFAILSTLTASVMNRAFQSRERINARSEYINRFQSTMVLIQREVQQLVPRGIRSNQNQLSPALIGKPHYIEFTRGGVMNPSSQEKRSHLKRIAYICSNNELIRRSWNQLDSSNRSQYTEKVLLDNLTSCHFAYLTHTLQVLSEWRERSQNTQEFDPKALPKAIQFNFNQGEQVKVSWLALVPQALYVENQS